MHCLGRIRLSRAVLIASIGFAVAAAALGLTWSLDSQEPVPAAPVVAAPGPTVATPAPQGPSFDVVRVGEKGDAVVAGRAMPQAEVVLRDGERELGRAEADERGEWVLVPTLPLPPGARALSLEARNPDGVVARSAAPVILVVPESAAQPALAVAPQAEGGARLMLGPGGEAGPLTVDLVDRDGTGTLFIGGRAPAGAALHLYLNNKFLGRTRADDDGGWRLAVKGDAGAGVVRADVVDDKGKVRTRIEVPLAPPVADAVAGESVVVEPGASLWTIARRAYGDGAAYTIIYGANRANIRDPDRIYPGQVVQVPKN